jgi:hypothetical protein
MKRLILQYGVTLHSETVHYQPGKSCGSITAAIIAALRLKSGT